MTFEILSGPLDIPPIARSAMAGGEDPRYERRPSGKTEWTARAKVLLEQSSHDWLERLQPAFDASGEAAKRLARSAGGKGLVVTTGQQPGLFGGPVYTLSKAVAALAMANVLQEVTGVPVAPVFWAATDDSDFREASRIAISADSGPRELVIEHAVPLGLPMSKMPLGDVTAPLEELIAASGSAADPRPLELLRKCYTAKHTVGGAYVELMRALLDSLGVAVLDASHQSVRASSLPTLQRALEHGDAIARRLSDANSTMESDGFAPQVRDVPGLSLVFESTPEGRKRIPIRRAGREFKEGAELGPNVLLRPILERQILPTLSYIGGPAEIAYFGQLGPIADALGVARPLILPRWSCTIVEPRIRVILTKLHLEIQDLRDPHAAEGRIARERVPRELLRETEKLRVSIDSGVDSLAVSLRSTALLPGESVAEGLRRTLLHRVDRLERRLVAASKRTHAAEMREIATARGALYPFGQPQERALSYIPFLARHSDDLLSGMLRSATEHARSLL